jgi:serine/threonine protein kinase
MEEQGTPFGQYRLIELIGRGGMGEVWRAYDSTTQRVVAVKVLSAGVADDKTFEQRFRREALAAAGLSDPHVVPIHHFGEIEGRLYVDMRLIEGRDLSAIIADGPMDPQRAVKIVEQVASALTAAHRIGLVHRDVKPSNILVAENDFAYLIDFGIARVAGEKTITGTGSVIGTWAYMAPERLNSGANDPRADTYALACVLHECLTGRQPYPGDSIEQQIGGHLGSPPPRPSALRRGLPVLLDAVIATGMAKSPDDRYATPNDLAAAARDAVAGSVPSTVHPRTPDPDSLETKFAIAGGVPRNYYPGSQSGDEPSRSDATQFAGYGTPGGPNPPARPQHPYPSGGGMPPGGTPPGAGPSPAPNTGPPNANRKRIILASSIVAVVAVIGIVLFMVLGNSGGSSGPGITAAPNTGPFTGTYTVSFGPELDVVGKEVTGGASPGKETWNVRSACGRKGCLATAARSSGNYTHPSTLTFDDISNRWYATALDQERCNNKDVEVWHWVYLREQPNGDLTGEWIEDSITCYHKRSVTFTRTGDTNISALPDPAGLPNRVASQALYLHGIYRAKVAVAGPTSKPPEDADYSVDTICLRAGDRCLSRFLHVDGSGRYQLFIFSNGAWTRNTEEDAPCATGGTSHVRLTGVFPLPSSVPDPIQQLTGSGAEDITGSTCKGGHYDQTFTRVGEDPVPH